VDNLEIMVQLALVVFAAAVTLVAALIDIRKFIIPNWCSLAVFVTGVAFAYFSGSLVTSFAVGWLCFLREPSCSRWGLLAVAT
jgi:Flp pilus assembly protein protease CpaA